MRLIVLLAALSLSFALSGCTTARIEVLPDGGCKAEYSSLSLGTFDSKELSGCGAAGRSENVDNSQLVTLPVSVLKNILGE